MSTAGCRAETCKGCSGCGFAWTALTAGKLASEINICFSVSQVPTRAIPAGESQGGPAKKTADSCATVRSLYVSPPTAGKLLQNHSQSRYGCASQSGNPHS
jgi:hypothetical protein